MAAQRYFFVTTWQLQAPIEAVWEVIYQVSDWPRWWSSVRAVELVRPGGPEQIGEVRRILWKGWLPYELAFDVELTDKLFPNLLAGKATGELSGTGTWYFTYHEGITTVRYEWNVFTRKKWMNRFSLLLKPFYIANHHFVMRRGARGLARRLQATLVSY